MTNVNSYVPEQRSALNGIVTSLFSLAIVVIAGALTFGVFVAA